MRLPEWIPADRRTLALSIAALGLLAAVVVWSLPLGRGNSAPAGVGLPVVVESASPKPPPSGKPVVPSRATVRSRPPARLFVASGSAPGMLVRVCEGGNCTTLPQGNPPTISSKAGGVLTFTVGERPTQAWAEIRGLPSGAPARHALSPDTLMHYPGLVAPGRYLLTLNVKFEKVEARWLFGLKVTS